MKYTFRIILVIQLIVSILQSNVNITVIKRFRLPSYGEVKLQKKNGEHEDRKISFF